MASHNFIAFLAVLLVLLPMKAKGDDLSTYVDKICDEVQCGKGTCKVALGYPFNFKCECEANWKRTRLDNEDDLQFLPCIIPNCSMNYDCMPAPPPLPSNPYNLSVFDPCYWIYCGEGTCTKNATYTHTCQCKSGYSNLLDISVYPCYNECALGSDCGKLGIKISSSKSSSTDDGSEATSILPGKIHWIALSLMPIIMVLWI